VNGIRGKLEKQKTKYRAVKRKFILNFQCIIPIIMGARGGVVVKELRYKVAGRGFDSRWYRRNFSVT
jgi:hypothetical protein